MLSPVLTLYVYDVSMHRLECHLCAHSHCAAQQEQRRETSSEPSRLRKDLSEVDIRTVFPICVPCILPVVVFEVIKHH